MGDNVTIVVKKTPDQVSISSGEDKTVRVNSGGQNNITIEQQGRNEVLIRPIQGPGFIRVPATSPSTVTVQTGNAFGGGGGGASRVDHIVSLKGRVPNSGETFLRAGEVATNDAPVPVDVASVFVSAYLNVDKADASNDYELQLLKNGTVVEQIALASGQTEASSTSLTTTFVAGDKWSAKLTRTAGSGKSDFSTTTVVVKLEET